MIRDEVRELAALGPLPATAGVDELRSVDEHRELLGRIVGPVTLEEAQLLLKSFGPDDCYGLAWALLHLIESAPDHVLDRAPSADENEWVCFLWRRLPEGADDSERGLRRACRGWSSWCQSTSAVANEVLGRRDRRAVLMQSDGGRVSTRARGE